MYDHHCLGLGILILLCINCPTFGATQYKVTDLGTLGGSISYAYGINNSGQVAGWSYLAENSTWHAFLYDGTAKKDLGTLGGSISYAYGINNTGQVVGNSYTTGDSVAHAFFV